MATTSDPVYKYELGFREQGDALVVDVTLQPGGRLPKHFHPATQEVWTVLDGDVEFVVDGATLRPPAGQPVVVAAGVRHQLANAGSVDAHLRAEVTPAGKMRAFLEEAAAFNREGRLTPRGLPTSWGALRDAATFVLEYRDTTVLLLPPPFPPRAVQRALFPLLAR